MKLLLGWILDMKLLKCVVWLEHSNHTTFHFLRGGYWYEFPEKSSRLEGKDLITIGIYTVIYVVIVMLVAMLGFIPIFIPLMAVLCPLIGGIPYMLYVTKAKNSG